MGQNSKQTAVVQSDRGTDSRSRNYRIPFERVRGRVQFPTIRVLFEFVKDIVVDLVGEPDPDALYDSEVARFVYPGYPYAHQFKLGMKNVSNIVELQLLARNLGIPMDWIRGIRSGDLTLRKALELYRDRKGDADLAASAEHFSSAGAFTVTIRGDSVDPGLLGEVYAQVIRSLRTVVSDPRIEKRSGTLV